MLEEGGHQEHEHNSHDHRYRSEGEPVGVGDELGDVERRLAAAESQDGTHDVGDQRSVGVHLVGPVDSQQQLREEHDVDEVRRQHPQRVHAVRSERQDGAQHADDDHGCDGDHRDLLLRGAGTEQRLVHVDGEHGGRGQVRTVRSGERGGGDASETQVGDHSGREVLDDVREGERLLALQRAHLGELAPVHGGGVDAHERRRDGAHHGADARPDGHHPRVLHGLAGEHALEVHLPGNASQTHQQRAVDPRTHLVGRNAAQPDIRGLRGVAHVLAGGHEGNADEQTHQHHHQLHHVCVRHRVHASHEGQEARADRRDDDGDTGSHTQQDRKTSSQSRESHADPEDIAQTGGEIEESHHPVLVLLTERVEHGEVFSLTHLLAEENASDEEADTVTPRSLCPGKPRALCHNALSGTIQITAAHPGGDHGDDAHQPAEVTASKSQLDRSVSLLLLRSPDTHTNNDHVEADKSDNTNNIKMLHIRSKSRSFGRNFGHFCKCTR